jgi:hypothetical protein
LFAVFLLFIFVNQELSSAELSWLMMDLWSWSPCQAHHAIHSQRVPQWNSLFTNGLKPSLWHEIGHNAADCRLLVMGLLVQVSSYQDDRFGETCALCN